MIEPLESWRARALPPNVFEHHSNLSEMNKTSSMILHNTHASISVTGRTGGKVPSFQKEGTLQPSVSA